MPRTIVDSAPKTWAFCRRCPFVQCAVWQYPVTPDTTPIPELSPPSCAQGDQNRRDPATIPASGSSDEDRILGGSASIREALAMLQLAASSKAGLLLQGESGTGKELFAKAAHRASRCEGPFIAVNCAAIPRNLLESELFGHAQGAFTDACRDSEGLFRRAQGGSLFLDEVGELPPDLQPKILRALQERRIRPVGGRSEVPVDVRIIAATNRTLETYPTFRRDLYYRLAVIVVTIPPLRRRGEDITLLAEHFVTTIARRLRRPAPRLSAEALTHLQLHHWPGNVRELENCLERAMALSRGGEIDAALLPSQVRRSSSLPPPLLDGLAADGEIQTLAEMERRYVRWVLSKTGGNRSAAAQLLQIDRKTLLRKLNGV